jgi:hypothetical protein
LAQAVAIPDKSTGVETYFTNGPAPHNRRAFGFYRPEALTECSPGGAGQNGCGWISSHYERRGATHMTVHEQSSTTDAAVWGENTDSGPGVLGTSVDNFGVAGVSTNSIAVVGRTLQ